jgi:tRNA/rRNA methyltransferase
LLIVILNNEMKQKQLQQVRIILVEPAGALNVGSVARIMKNMGLRQLVLVNPQCDPSSYEARLMAVHGRDLLAQAQEVGTLAEALQGCQYAIATTAFSRTLPLPLETPKVALPSLLTKGVTSALIFGREDHGLTNEELNYAQRLVGIPASDEYSSLNLAQAVAICGYELYQATLEETPATTTHSIRISPETASLDLLEGYYNHLEEVLLEIQYLYPHTAASRMKKFRNLFKRANLTAEEVAMLRGILRQTTWAIEKARNHDT